MADVTVWFWVACLRRELVDKVEKRPAVGQVLGQGALAGASSAVVGRGPPLPRSRIWLWD